MGALAFLSARAWLDEDDGYHVWIEHECTEGRVATMLSWPTWHAEGTRVMPSIDCRACGAHYFAEIEE